MRKKLAVKGLVVVLCLGLAAGCLETALLSVGAAGAIGAYKWLEGTMEKEYPRSFAETWQAVLSTTEHYRMKIAEKKSDPMSGKIVAVQPDNTEVKITVTGQPNNITTVGVRFGMFGNKEASAMFHQQLMRELGIQ